MAQPLEMPAFTAMSNLEGALTGALEECEEALLSYRDAGLDHPYIPARVREGMNAIDQARAYLQAAKAGVA